MIALEHDTPSAWVGCLGCYNAGELHGEWIDALAATDVGELSALGMSLEDDGRCQRCGSDELWTFDHEGYGGLLTGECSPAQAQHLAELLAGQDEPAAFVAYAEHVGDVDYAADTFKDAYRGEWDDLEDYAYEFLEDTGSLPPEGTLARTYFDVAAFARDLELGGDVFTSPTPEGGVFVFDAHV